MKLPKEIILQENPFSLEFDIDKLNKLIEDETLQDEDKDIIDFSFLCHKMFRNCYKGFIEVFEHLKLSKEETLRFIFIVVNYNYLEIRKLYFKQFEERRKEQNILSLESTVFEKIKFDKGVDIPLAQGLEKGGDVVIILLKFFNSVGKSLIGQRSISEYPDELLKEFSVKLWNLASEFYSFDSFFGIVKHESGKVIIEEDGKIIKIKKSEKNTLLATLEVIAEVRSLNNYHEYSFGFKSILKEKIREKSILSQKIVDGEIFPNVGYKNSKESFIRDAVLSIKTANIFSKADYGDIDLIELIKIFTTLSQMVEKVSEEVITKNFTIIHTPFCIDKNLLIDKIQSIVNLDKDKINAVINSITDKSDSPYFWRKPLYENNNKIYTSFSLLIAPNYNLLLESYCETLTIELEGKQQRIKKYILSELTNLKYCTIIPDDEVSNTILVELRDYYLVINNFYVQQFPIEAKENLDYLDEIIAETFKIEEKLNILNEKGEKPYFPVILTNYNKYSGLILNEIPVVDIILLKNYLLTGAFQKGQMVRNKQGIKTDIISGFAYYDDEDDFNNNLLNFLKFPIPVYEIKNKIFWTETPILPPDFNIQIYIDHYNYENEEGNIEYELTLLSNTLKNQYLINPKGKINDLSNKNILFRLTNIFHYITFSKYQLTSYRHNLINLFSEINIDGYVYLLHYFRMSLKYLNNVKLKKDVNFKSVEYNSKDVFKILEKIFEKNTKISVTTLDFNHKYSKDDEKKIISLAIDVMSTITIKKYEAEEIENYLLMLAIIRYFKAKYNLNDYFYLGVSNIISALNHNFLYQQARNLAEEIFAIAILERKEHKGWGILFLCSDQQRNKFTSLIYSCFYLNSLSVVDKLPYREAIDIFYNVLKFTRSIEIPEILDNVFNFMKSLKLEDYDFQKVHLTYYLSIGTRKQEERRKIIEESIIFFNENMERIFNFGDKGATPWLNYFYNVKRLNNEGFITVNVDDIIELIEKTLAEEDVLSLKSRHFYNINTKQNFIKNLQRVFSTYYVNDFVSEISNLEMDANIIIENALKENDYESILLTGIVLNDVRLIYKENYNIRGGEVEFIINNSNSAVFDQYLNYILDNLVLKPYQLFLYIFSNKDIVYYLKINSKKEVSIKHALDWKANKNILKRRDKFYFNSANYYGIEEQEEHYKNLLNEIHYTSLNLNDKYDELLIATNLELSHTPLNLVVNNADFMGSQTPITNVLLLEWFVENNHDITIDNLSVNCWIPTEDGDPTISLGHDKLKPILEKYEIETYTKSIPDRPLDKDINIFFAHGELDNVGFKAVSVNDEKFVINKEKIFGKGKIAILFICHSGSMNEDIFSNKVQSLIYELVQYGYKSVIAPFWALDVTIPSFWLEYFLENFKSGYSISESVYLANNSISDYQHEISNSFFVPEGRLAMHLYGNPNLKLKSV